MTSQSYILTLFTDNLLNGGWIRYHDEIYEDGKTLYIGSQLETCPDTGRPHWQAFVKFNASQKQRGTYFKKFHNSIHFEKCSKERSAAINYGTKAETRLEGPKESGTKPAAIVKGTDWVSLKDAITSNRKEGVDFGLVIRFNLERRWHALREFYQQETRLDLPTFLPNPWGLVLPSSRNSKKRHYWIWSQQPDKGKTFHFAKPLEDKYRLSIVTGDVTYYNILSTDQCVIFDEYNSQLFKYSSLNSMCDGTFNFRKCGTSSLRLKNPLIIILSNQSINSLYPIRGDLLHARFNEYELL